ncbi:MAG: M23 family metallopeptidase [Treponema sp.]|nr:M23 family metallopeptidase [Treponema sp.]
MKKHIILTLLILLGFAAFAELGRWQTDDYGLSIQYNKTVQPGDAVFARLILKPRVKKVRKLTGTSTGTMQIFTTPVDGSEQKSIGKTAMYLINKDQKGKGAAKNDVLLAGVPLSSYCKPGDYQLTVTFSAFGKPDFTFSLPVTVTEKEFISETIPLNASNTAIRTDTSKTRMDQINRLNAILEAKNMDSVFCDGAFSAPNPATRRTSFFADRRIFAYNNGKSSTSLHYGIDYGIPTGSEVRACASGKVVMAENRITTGWSICIEHLPGLYSLYYHMSELKAEVGQMVQQGELIGISGATGLATGPHLHWEIRLNMAAVSPDFFIGDFTFANTQESKTYR